MYMKLRKYFLLMIVSVFLLGITPTAFGESALNLLCPGEGVKVVAAGGFYSATPADNAIDGDFSTNANTGNSESWYVIDLGAVQNVGAIKFYGRADRLQNLYNIYGSDDNTNYEKVLLGQPTSSAVTIEGTSYALFQLENVTSRARYIKIASAQAQYTRIFSTEIYEAETEAPALDTPTNLTWSGQGTLSWDAVSNATSYDVILYKNDIFVQEYRGVTATTVDVTADMRLSGPYTATVVANATGYISSVTPAESAVNQYSGLDNLTYNAQIVAGAETAYWYASNMPTLFKDGNYETYASTQLTSKGFVVLDLGALYDVNTIDLYMLDATDFEVYYSDDGADYEKAKFPDLITNKGLVTISKKEMKHYSVLTNFVARYIKLAETAIARTNICEAEIFGTPACAQTLATPQAPVWESKNTLRFTGVENASSYVLRLYKDGALVKVYEDLTETTVDCSDDMTSGGRYSATVFAKAEGYNASATSAFSSVNDYFKIGNIALAANGTSFATSQGFYGSTPATAAIDGDYSTYARTGAAAGNYFVLDFGKTSYIENIEGYSTATTLKNIYDVYYSNSPDNFEENYAGQLTIRSETINGTPFLVYSMPMCTNARYLKIIVRSDMAIHFEEFEVYGVATTDATSYFETLYTAELRKSEEFNSYTKYILPQAEAPYTCTYSVSDSGSAITGNILKITNNGAQIHLTMSLSDGTNTFTTTRVLTAPTASAVPVYVILNEISKTSDTTASVYALLSNDNLEAKTVTAVIAQYKDGGLLGVQTIEKRCDAFAAECELSENVTIDAAADTVKFMMLSDTTNLMPISVVATIQ